MSFAAVVLRVLADNHRPRPLLFMIEASGTKLIINTEHVKDGAKLKGGDTTTLTGLVTQVGSSMVDDLVPVSIAVDG